MNNEPVAWYNADDSSLSFKNHGGGWQPLYTHPAKELHLSLQKSKETGELLAVTYTDDEHRIVEVLWKKPSAKTLTDEDIAKVVHELNQKARTPERWVTAMEIGAETIIQLRDELRKAQE